MILGTLLSLLLASSVPGARPAARAAQAARPSPAPVSPDELFSRRALRRARLLIEMRVLQLRDERLECVREALARQLPSALWPEQPTPSRGTANLAAAAARCAKLLRF